MTMRTKPTLARRVPPLVALAVSYTLLVVVGVAALFRHTGLSDLGVANPFGQSEEARQFFSSNSEAARVGGFFCFVSAIPLVMYTATIVARLQFLGARHAGVYTAFAGGIAASGGLAAAGLFLWSLSVPEVAASLPTARALHFLVFLCGGPAFAVGAGLLAGGASISGHRASVLPRWVVGLGLLLATTGALSTLGLLSIPMTFPIPITRVGEVIWLMAVGATLPDSTPTVSVDRTR